MTPRRERDLDAERQSHLEMHVADNIRAGMGPDEARRTAVLALGGVEQTKERYRQGRRARIIEEFLQDFRFGVRTLVKHKAASATIIVILALVSGATTAIFSVVNGVLLQPLAFSDPDRLVEVSLSVPAGELDAVTSGSFEHFTSHDSSARHMQDGASTERVRTITTDREFFPLSASRPQPDGRSATPMRALSRYSAEGSGAAGSIAIQPSWDDR